LLVKLGMQAGFAMLEAGTVRPKNTNNILFKNLMDASLGAIGFWLLGYSFAFGNNRTVSEGGTGEDNGFIGAGNWALHDFDNETGDYHLWFFQWTFAAAAATIVSGSVAERCRLEAYFIYTLAMTVFIYPVVAHWVWAPTGFLSAFYTSDDGERYLPQNGVIDFAGSGVVHAVGGFAGLVGTITLGPRMGFFGQGDAVSSTFKGSNELLCSLGVSILWMGWYGFNAGSTLGAGSEDGAAIRLAAKVCVTTTISAAMGAITTMMYSRLIIGHYNLSLCLNGVLAGLVSVTAGSAVIEPWGALLTGIIGGIVYTGGSWLLKRWNIDDPLNAFPVHGLCGVWGLLAVGMFATRANIKFAYGFDNDAVETGNQFRNQLLGAVCIVSWTVVMSSLVFLPLSFFGMLRVTPKEEKLGLDVIEHGIPWRHENAKVRRTRRKPKGDEEGEAKTQNAV